MTGVGYDPVGELLDGGAVRTAGQCRPAVEGSGLVIGRTADTARGRSHVEGDPTEGALVVAAVKVGLDQAELNEEPPPARNCVHVGAPANDDAAPLPTARSRTRRAQPTKSWRAAAGDRAAAGTSPSPMRIANAHARSSSNWRWRDFACSRLRASRPRGSRAQSRT